LLGFVALGAWGCTEVYLRAGRIDGVREIVLKALDAGAIRCAPQEIALAQAHMQFASTELDQGDPDRAEEHLILSEANARAALRLSPKDQCAHDRPGDKDGDGLPDTDDKCPTNPEDHDGVEDDDGCPEDQDSDGDTVPDSHDLCVASAEDADGYLDTDGCPDEDNDVDLIADLSDKCPLEPEDPDTFQDDDGCPDPDNDGDGLLDVNDACPNEHGLENTQGCPKVYKNVVVTDAAVVIKEQVHFATNKAVIRPQSFALLDTVAQALNDFPGIRVEVQGHTDDRGSDRKNLKLSQQRAEAVRSYLISRGIEPFRMTAVGYGEKRPIDSNSTEVGRAANRRVEFVRTDEHAQKRSAGAAQEGGVP
jgi:outer membrane protein OmpA-like peptidoglycan-associated protein